MRSIRDSIQTQTQSAEVNLSPLIDVVFLLLIFFVVTTVFVEETGVDVEKPKAMSARELDRRSIMLALTDEGRIVFDGREVTLNSVRGIVARQLRAQAGRPVIILADRGSRSGRLVEVIDECKLAGAEQVSVAAARKARP
jgi:biopolymer transport protein ExbD